MRPQQLTAEDLETMSTAEVTAAAKAGQLRDLREDPRIPATGALNERHLAIMAPEDIEAARKAGRLDALLGKPTRHIPPRGQLNEEHLKLMTPEEIVAAEEEGRLDELLGRTTEEEGRFTA
jgi:hypothetical protein